MLFKKLTVLKLKDLNQRVVAGVSLTIALSFIGMMSVQLMSSNNSRSLASRKPAQQSNDLVHKKAIELVNKNLQMNQKLKELRAMGVEIKNEKALEQYRQKLTYDHATAADRDLGVEILIEDGSTSTYEDLNPHQGIYNGQLTPDEKIEMRLNQQRDIAVYERNQKLQYVRQFLENARKQGYDITLNENLEVVKVRKIPQQGPYKGLDSIDRISE
ncbi:hypothetical protein KDA06_05380 [Candidatus Saccharibacteria bacterium]|nr:hypothetical protein [Candidatus Saccharibacteria bacterium]